MQVILIGHAYDISDDILTASALVPGNQRSLYTLQFLVCLLGAKNRITITSRLMDDGKFCAYLTPNILPCGFNKGDATFEKMMLDLQ